MRIGTTGAAIRRPVGLRTMGGLAAALLVAATACGIGKHRDDARAGTAATAAEAEGNDVGAEDVEATAVERTGVETTALEAAESDSGRIEYRPGLYLSLVEPDACAGGPRPAMVTLDARFAYSFAARGYLGVVVEAHNPGFEAQSDSQIIKAVAWAVHDMAIAVQWLRAHAEEYCVEPNAVAATGHSFGALAALALAYSEGEGSMESITIDELGTTISVEPAELGTVPAELAAYSNDLDGVVSFSGFALPDHIDSGEPPAILFHGRNDTTIPFSLAEATCDAAGAVGVSCELVAHDAGHSQPPDLPAALDEAVQFLDREMLIPAGLAALG